MLEAQLAESGCSLIWMQESELGERCFRLLTFMGRSGALSQALEKGNCFQEQVVCLR